MTTDTDQAGAAPAAPGAPGAPAELPPEFQQLQAVAAAADAAVSGAQLVPGQAQAPEVDPAEELADLLSLGVKVGGHVLPPLPKHFPPDTCRDIADAYIECAKKHGWTWHEKTGGPELRLGLAIGVPAFLCVVETRQWMAWQREQDAKKAAESGHAGITPS